VPKWGDLQRDDVYTELKENIYMNVTARIGEMNIKMEHLNYCFQDGPCTLIFMSVVDLGDGMFLRQPLEHDAGRIRSLERLFRHLQ
jgi:hypothetical protein